MFLPKNLLLIFVLFILVCPGIQGQEKEDFTQYVNPFIGTAPLTDPDFIGYTPPEGWRVWAGLVFPGAAMPNAMVQISPVTEYGTGSGYEYEAKEILSFAHTNKGHWNLVHIPVLPVQGTSGPPYQSTFEHEGENASPGYYEVFLKDYQVNVQLAAGKRSGIHRYEFHTDTDRFVVFDLGRANNEVSSWELKQLSDNELTGHQIVGRDQIHFYAQLSHSIDNITETDANQPKGFAKVKIADGNADPVTMKISLSFVSAENARLNFEEEIQEISFQELKAKGKETWNELLSQIEVKGGSDKERELFYTSLYRSFLWPALRSDVNMEFRDVKGEVAQEDFYYYTNPSFWDTYRNKLVLFSLLQPDTSLDVIKSLLDQGRKTGFIPTFFHGDHAIPYITGSYKRGIQDFEVEEMYQYLLNNAYKEDGPRAHILEYIEKGFISDPDVENPEVETKGKAGVSKTLEYAYDDYALALLAKELGDDHHYKELMERSGNYRHVFDTDVNFMRGRLANGDWITPFDPTYPYYEYMYREANAWQVSFYVKHDMPGLIALYGGEEAFEAKLDSLFTVPWNPEYIARNVSSFLGQYSQGNQPGHEAPFAYHFIGKPEKSQAIIDILLSEYYGVGPEGLALPGMDDAGEMSSWYVFSALGLYPYSPADDKYLITVPIFDEVIWKIADKPSLTIKTEGKGRALQEIKFDGENLEDYFLPHAYFEKGGVLTISTTD